MTETSCVLICTTASRNEANALAESMGWGADNYQVPLTSDGTTITHYGLHVFTSDTFRGWVEGTEPLPDGMEYAQPIIDGLIHSFRDDVKNRAHFDAVLTENGLAQWVDPEGPF